MAKNGAGKSSLLKILAGIDLADEGKISLRGGIKLEFLEQEPRFNPQDTVLEAVISSSDQIFQVIKEYEIALLSGQKAQIAAAHEQMDHLEAWDVEARVKQILGKLNIHHFLQPIRELSGGQVKRVALAKTLLCDSDILLLDEPTNHLDLDMVEWLEGHLGRMKTSILMVTHDRYFLDRVCNHILELDNQQLFTYQGNYSYFLEKKEERIQNTTARIEKAQNLYKKELDWINRMPSARTTKSKSRIEAFSDIEAIARQKLDTPTIEFNLSSPRIGKKILDLYDVSKSFGSFHILQNFSYRFKPGEKTGIIGPNGSGKTTLLNIIGGLLKADSGKIEIGETIKLGYFKQEGLAFKEDMRVLDLAKEIAEVVSLGDGRKIGVSQFLQFFLFPPDLQRTPIAKLSGGERRRLHLVYVLMQNPNFLLLDEPTNDLDIQTLQVLEEYLLNFKGCLLIVSHDRFFLDKITDHLFVFGEQGKVVDFPGNFSQYRDHKRNHIQIKKSASPVKEKVKEREPDSSPKKAGFREKFEFTQIEKELEELEEEKKQLEDGLSSGIWDQERLIRESNRLGTVLQLIDEKTNRWLELSELIQS